MNLELLLFVAAAIVAGVGVLLDARGRAADVMFLLLSVGLIAAGLAVAAA